MKDGVLFFGDGQSGNVAEVDSYAGIMGYVVMSIIMIGEIDARGLKWSLKRRKKAVLPFMCHCFPVVFLRGDTFEEAVANIRETAG